MKINNETKVGILTIVAITLLIVGFNFLKGKNLFNKEKHLYAVFGELGSLKKSNEVKINGLPVGIVYNYTEIDKNLSGIIVTITLKRDVNIPKNSIATIESELLGTTYINISKGDKKEFLADGDTLVTNIASSLLGDVKAQINPTLGKIREAIDSLKMVLSGVSNLFEKDTKGNIQEIINNLKETTVSLKTLLDTDKGAFASTLKNASSITDNLKKNNDSITAAISSIRKTAVKFSSVDIQPAIDSLQASVSELKKMLAKINSNDGTLGLLMNDRRLYDKLNEVLLSAEILFDDLRLHPKRYTGSILFNRKDKTGPLTSPSKKDSVSQAKNK
jgi:phospholipid/cholesterol/gamma-HCH transport system substrate-binding protein